MHQALIVECPYCKQSAELVTGRVVYPHRPDLAELRFWVCWPCKAWTGTHSNSRRYAPKGRLATAELRRYRREAHEAFDVLWKRKLMGRQEAYKWLKCAFGMDRTPHIGHLNEIECGEVVKVSRACFERQTAR